LAVESERILNLIVSSYKKVLVLSDFDIKMAVSLLLGMLVTSLIGLISLSWLAFCNRQEVSWDQFVFG